MQRKRAACFGRQDRADGQDRLFPGHGKGDAEPGGREKSDWKSHRITDDTIIEENLACSETHRAFFIQRIGKGFSFNVPFQKWLKANAGKTYREAVEAYCRILEEKKNGKTAIAAQFEYNTYIRDFFASNHGRSLEDAIVCWKYKKSLPGHNRYEKSDLIALD